ncbi:hypothetical protein E4T50_09393 [Aureobasidium sp. EXF-12298]|nr:hypothetical protein E4T50_09393 [Aureobasidium sp. EXF-12298]KAI4761453.1 hypothetical protein E4T51_05527 [Aureobasidium sp. EXF-12344]KAI4778684.1 hypothetical protein E4T52_06377 [Aureobasidium sp. EXF-3400]
MVKSSRICFLLALAVAVSATEVLVPKHLPTRKLLCDAYAYSLEPVWTQNYISSNLTRNLINFLYTLNLRDNSSAWENAVQEAAAACSVLGDKLKLFGIGNEIDHFINKGCLQAGIQSLSYGRYFMAHVLASDKQQRIAQIPSANISDFSGYAIYAFGTRHHEQLDKIVLIDLQIWNGTQGLSNPSTLSTTDSLYHSSGQRPVRKVSMTTCWLTGTRLGVIRLQTPGTNAKSEISVFGLGFDPQTGVQIGALRMEEIVVGGDGRICLKMQAAEAVLLYRR